MENTVPSSRKSLLKILEEIREWRSSRVLIHDEAEIPWTESHIYAASDYVLKFGGFYFRTGSYTSITTLGEDWKGRSCEDKQYKIFAKSIAAFFTQELQELFKVPKLQKLCETTTVKRNEVVAAFINFLLQLLYHRTDSMKFFEDQINSLERGLGFLVTVLGDTSFMVAELEQVQNLLAEFEAAANDAASLLYSFIFLSVRLLKPISIHKLLDALLKRIEILKANIIKFSNLLPFVRSDDMTPKTVSVDSLFIVDSLLCDLDELMNRNDGLTLNVKDQIRMLHQHLTLSQSMLKGIKVSPHNSVIQDLRARTRDVAYEAEYLINSFLVGDATHWYLTIRLTDIIHKITLIWTGLQEIKKNCDLAVLQVAEDFSSQMSLQTRRVAEVDDIMVGFEDRATYLLDQLVGGREKLQTLSIFGMAGLGKTTLAKKLYNHPSVNYRFDRRSWCIISQSYQRSRLLTEILIGLTSELEKDRILNVDEEILVERIYKCLKRRRYLIVMDDIWDPNAWNDMRRCFPDDQNGSRILFTSRNKDVAPPDSLIYPLSSLSDDQCWELLEKKVFHNEPCPPELQGIGKQIAAKCWGLPLAVVAIAGILSNMGKKEITWKNVEGRLGSYIYLDQRNSMTQILKLSYKHLSEHLKPCFLYFGLFPEDKEIGVRKLMRLWIGEGFIRKEERKSAESVAEEYLMELIDKSLVIVSKRRSDGGVKACVIHDLLHELCRDISKQENFLKFVDYTTIYLTSPSGWRARSFHDLSWDKLIYVGNMKLIRVLNFERYLPRSVVGMQFLVQLRYLVITDLPVSIGSLVNLEYLFVMTDEVVTIPSVIVKMMKLRYFCVGTRARYDEDCDSSQTNNLESLSGIMIRNPKDEEILKCSPNLRKLKCSFEKSYMGDLRFLTQLESLNLQLFFSDDVPQKMAEFVLPSNIKKLSLRGLSFSWEKMSIIGGLPKLEVLKLQFNAFIGETWETRDGEFQQLRFLKLDYVHLRQWNVASNEHFPKLQRLVLRSCDRLGEIPCEIGEISTLQSIELQGECQKSLIKSARQIEQEQRDMGNEELSVIIAYIVEHIFE